MRKYALWNTYEEFNYDNAAFDRTKFQLSNDLNDWMIVLKRELAKKDIELVTPDIYPLGEYDGYIFVDYPSSARPETLAWISNTGKPMYLILFENPMVKPINYVPEYHKAFTKVFTWWRDIPETDLYVHINIPNRIRTDKIWWDDQKRFATMVACNKKGHGEGELYSQRKRIIDYFTTYYGPDFDLYGIGWDEEPANRGYIKDKLDMIGRYKFTFAIENYKGLNGYLTEKLFDCLFAGTIPIYYGEPNIQKIVPKDTILLLSDYVDLSDLGITMATMSDEEIRKRRDNIRDFIQSEKIKDYSTESFVGKVMEFIA